MTREIAPVNRSDAGETALGYRGDDGEIATGYREVMTEN
jgi:hypothetical protein